MIDAVGTLSVSNTNLRASSQAAVVSAAASTAGRAAGGFVSSYIRVDNLQNIAILEVRETDTGEVLQQFPSKSQIQAFKRAEQLQRVREEAPQVVETSAPSDISTDGETAIEAAPAPAPQVVNTAPSAPAPVSADTATTTSSIIV